MDEPGYRIIKVQLPEGHGQCLVRLWDHGVVETDWRPNDRGIWMPNGSRVVEDRYVP